MQKLQLDIPEPCHENWNNMTPTDQGRFCNACSKVVVDFAMMTDTEVLNYFSTLTHEKVCGRVLPSQLNREIRMPKEPRKRLFWYWNYIVMFFLFISKSNSTRAQGKLKPNTTASPTCAKTLGEMVVPLVRQNVEMKGKITDPDGNPIPFATVKIKGHSTGLSADVNGAFSIKIKPGDILLVSAAGYRNIECPIGSQPSLNIVLEKAGEYNTVVITRAGGISYRNPDEDYSKPVLPKHVAVFEVKDSMTNAPLGKATLMITKSGANKTDTGFTDRKGIYKLKRVGEKEAYDIRVTAEGYEANEFSISGNEFNERKEAWEVYMTPSKATETKIRSANTPAVGKETIIRLGNISTIQKDLPPIYVLDGIIIPNNSTVNPDDIAEITVLQGPAASALYGPAGMNGAIIMISKQSKPSQVKVLDTVKVKGDFGTLRRTSCQAGEVTIRGGMIKTKASKVDQKIEKPVADNFPVTTKIFPNPVSRGQSLTIDISTGAGQYEISIFQASGVLMEKRPVNIATGQPRVNLPVGMNWVPGKYTLVITGQNGKPLPAQSFIVL